MIDNPDKIKSLEGCDLLIMEESAKTPRYVWDKVIPTIRENGAGIVTIYNPDWEHDETHDLLVNKQELLELGRFTRHINYLDNPFCPESILIEAETMKREDYERYEHIYLGKPKSTTKQQIFNGCYEVVNFDPSSFERDKNSNHYLGVPQYYYGLQWGYSQTTLAAVCVFEYDDCLFVYRCIGNIGLELADIDVELRKLPNIETAKIRACPQLPSTLKNIRKRSRLKLIEADTWQGEDIDKIMFMRGEYKKIYIHQDCTEVIDDFKHYWWEIDEKENRILDTPIDEHNQYIKAIGHAICRRVKGVI